MPTLTVPLISVTLGKSLPLPEPQLVRNIEIWCVNATRDSVSDSQLALDKLLPSQALRL